MFSTEIQSHYVQVIRLSNSSQVSLNAGTPGAVPAQEVVMGPEYTLIETIDQLEGWTRGKRMYPIEVGISASHWFECASERDISQDKYEPSFLETREALKAWLLDSSPYISEDLGFSILEWLRVIEQESWKCTTP